MSNLYEALGVAKGATADEIKKAYRALARQYHPDRNPGDAEAEQKFKDVQSAYEVLGDPQKREAYDLTGDPNASASGNPFRRGKPFSSILESFFHDFMGGGPAGQNVTTEITVTLDDVLRGAEVDVRYTRVAVCPRCKASSTPCAHCGGTGERVVTGRSSVVRTPCPHCQGGGTEPQAGCGQCEGGYVDGPEQVLKFKVPPGVEDGMRFQCHGLGNPTNGETPAGDLYVVVRVEAHALFERGGRGTLAMVVPVTYTQLVLGDEVELPVVDGGTVRFKLPAGTQPGAKFRFAQLGLPIFNNGGPTYVRGDMFAVIRLEVPTAVGVAEEKLLRELAEQERSLFGPQRKEFLERVGAYRGRTEEE